MTASDSPTITSVGDALFEDIDRDLTAGGYDGPLSLRTR
jgi:hypothetical protein